MLEARDISVDIGSVSILRGVGFSVADGGILGLVGRNGAGKTTTMRGVMGLARLGAGEVRLDGRDITGLPAHRRARLGIGYLPEDRRLIPALSVEENLMLPMRAMGTEDAPARLETAYELLPEVREIARSQALNLSGGQQKFVALGRSFMVASRLLLLDEPFEGVSMALSRRLADSVRTFQGRMPGLAVLVSESDLRRAAMLAEHACVIERGEIVDEARVGDIRL